MLLSNPEPGVGVGVHQEDAVDSEQGVTAASPCIPLLSLGDPPSAPGVPLQTWPAGSHGSS